MFRNINHSKKLKSSPLLVLALLMYPAASIAADPLAGATDCSFLPPALCPKNGDLNQALGGTANWLVGLIGAVIVVMIIVSGIQVASAADNPDRLKAAKKRLTNAVVSLVALLLMRAILGILGITV